MVTPGFVTRLSQDMGQPGQPLAEELVTRGLWKLDGDENYQIVEWDEWQSTPPGSKKSGSVGGLKSAHTRGFHEGKPNPNCPRCVENSGESPVPPLEYPLTSPQVPVEQKEKETENEMSVSGSEQLSGVEPQMFELAPGDSEDESDTARIMRALLDARRRLMNAPTWEPVTNTHRRWLEAADVLQAEYDTEYVIEVLGRISHDLWDGTKKPFTQTPNRHKISDQFAAVVSETTAKPKAQSSGFTFAQIEENRRLAALERATWETQ